MVIIINGPLGVGKTEVSWALIEQFDRAIMLDGDYIGASHPFEIHDKQRVVYLYKTIAHLVKFHLVGLPGGFPTKRPRLRRRPPGQAPDRS